MRSSPRILVVDDLADWRATLAGFLTDAGYEVTAAGSIEQASSLLQMTAYELVILDMRLDETDESDLSGLTLARQIAVTIPSTKVIMITGYATKDRINAALGPDIKGHHLVDNVIEKGAIGENLLQAVAGALAS